MVLFLWSYINISLSSFVFFRFTERDHVKNNIPAKLLCIQTFKKMELGDFKDFIPIADYMMCEAKMEKNPTRYSITLDVFIKFLYKVNFFFAIVCFLPHVLCIYPYTHFCLY